jgi:hypothetical protein
MRSGGILPCTQEPALQSCWYNRMWGVEKYEFERVTYCIMSTSNFMKMRPAIIKCVQDKVHIEFNENTYRNYRVIKACRRISQVKVSLDWVLLWERTLVKLLLNRIQNYFSLIPAICIPIVMLMLRGSCSYNWQSRDNQLVVITFRQQYTTCLLDRRVSISNRLSSVSHANAHICQNSVIYLVCLCMLYSIMRVEINPNNYLPDAENSIILGLPNTL